MYVVNAGVWLGSKGAVAFLKEGKLLPGMTWNSGGGTPSPLQGSLSGSEGQWMLL